MYTVNEDALFNWIRSGNSYSVLNIRALTMSLLSPHIINQIPVILHGMSLEYQDDHYMFTVLCSRMDDDWIGLGGEMYCDLRSDRREFCTTPALDDKTHGRVASWSSVIRHHWAAVVALVGGGGAAEGSQGGFSRGIRAYQTYIESE
jgi:hypothetical protein